MTGRKHSSGPGRDDCNCLKTCRSEFLISVKKVTDILSRNGVTKQSNGTDEIEIRCVKLQRGKGLAAMRLYKQESLA